jgi:hypothetical protein
MPPRLRLLTHIHACSGSVGERVIIQTGTRDVYADVQDNLNEHDEHPGYLNAQPLHVFAQPSTLSSV